MALGLSLGNCCNTTPDCFGCSPSHSIPENITLSSSGFSWLVPESDVSYESLTFVVGGVNRFATTEHRFRSRPLTNINGTKSMRQKPDGQCWWLWNDVRAVSTVWNNAVALAAPLFEEVVYEPLNATDSTNPWDRVVLPNTDARCQVGGPYCEAGLDATTTVEVVVVEASGIFNLVCRIYNKIARSATTSAFDDGSGGGPISGFSAWGKPTPVNYTNRTAIAGTPPTLTTGATSVPPYRYRSSDSNYFPIGGLLVQYESPAIDCVADFAGSPITLTNVNLYPDRVTYWDATIPTTIEITL